ncbi:hypothetical protein AHAS_Ahas15G0111800 [Arachis hypogaea]
MKVPWNGVPSSSFLPIRGIRQGDPMSPYLFILCVERLSQIISVEVNHKLWEPIVLNRGGPELSQLSFADDILLSGKAFLDQVEIVKGKVTLAQTMRLSLSVCDKIDQICRNFVWDSNNAGRKIHLVSWEKLCLPKKFGGLGFRLARVVNNIYDVNKLEDFAQPDISEDMLNDMVSKYAANGNWDLSKIKEVLGKDWITIFSSLKAPEANLGLDPGLEFDREVYLLEFLSNTGVMIYDKMNGRSRIFGFVTMSSIVEVEAAKQESGRSRDSGFVIYSSSEEVNSAIESLDDTGVTVTVMASERESFDLSGPLYLTHVDWDNPNHRKSVAASLVQGVYVLEKDRQERREGTDALASPWWVFFNFQLLHKLVDDVDSSIFGAIYEFKPPSTYCNDTLHRSPSYVIAFRGTITKADSVSRDIELDMHFVRNGLHQTSRYEIAIQAVRNMIATVGDSGIWLAGHSLGSAVSLLCGKTMAKSGNFIESFLFNPPYVSAPIERIKDKKVKHGLRIAGSVITAGLTLAVKAKQKKSLSSDPFAAFSAWVPCLFVNPSDHICSEYIGYFEHRKKMEEIGAGSIERLATQNSLGCLLMGAFGKESEPLHLIPSASVTVNLTPSRDFKEAHGIHQWWKPHLHLQSKLYKY